MPSHAGAPYIQSFHARYSIFPECSRYLEDSCFPLCFRNPFKLFRGCYLIQAILFNRCYLLCQVIISTVFSFEWALTHKSFPRILPDSSKFFRSYSQILFKCDVRMDPISHMPSPRSLSNSFIVGSTSSLLILPVCLNNSWWCFPLSFSSFEDRRRVSL